jgi:hypothetical protein
MSSHPDRPNLEAELMGLAPGQTLKVDGCRLRIDSKPWAFALTNAAAIADHWQSVRVSNPAYFNGVVQILTEHRIDNGVFDARFATTDFASFLYWRRQRFPGKGVRDCFGAAVIRSVEGHILLGRQSAGNLNAGLAYCPGGFIDTCDIKADGTIDIDGSIGREITEETGLVVSTLTRTPGYLIAAAEASVAIGVEFRSELSADALRAQIHRTIAGEPNAELAEIIIVRQPDDLVGVPTTSYVRPLIHALFGAKATEDMQT